MHSVHPCMVFLLQRSVSLSTFQHKSLILLPHPHFQLCPVPTAHLSHTQLAIPVGPGTPGSFTPSHNSVIPRPTPCAAAPDCLHYKSTEGIGITGRTWRTKTHPK